MGSEQPNLLEIKEFLVGLARKAGEMIMAAHPSTGTSGSKKNSADLVTETDRAVEAMVSSSLKAKYPTYSFLGEETYKPGMKLTSAPTFICDPIDGTVNFVHSFPNVCISLGFTVNYTPVVGVIFNPFQSLLYSAISGSGATVTNVLTSKTQPLPLKQTPEPLTGLQNSLVAVEWGSDRNGNNWKTKTETFLKLAAEIEDGGKMVHSLRCSGSAALNLCAVAAGTIDVYWEAGCWAWDVCAGWVILKEAGGIMVDANPGNWEPTVDGRRYMAVRGVGNAGGQKEMVEEFWGVVGDNIFVYEN
ncbi:MAG: hypothetical protein M1834_001143 [Cirrosporium novae-zelandiae]|nr:MAG: hypothetical protein M1834_001143 [Cirrosporium novae-zelandiae]